MTPIDLDEMERIGKAATEAPWELIYSGTGNSPVEMYSHVVHEYQDIFHAIESMRFAVYARNNWQALVEELRQRREFMEGLKSCDDCNGYWRDVEDGICGNCR